MANKQSEQERTIQFLTTILHALKGVESNNNEWMVKSTTKNIQIK